MHQYYKSFSDPSLIQSGDTSSSPGLGSHNTHQSCIQICHFKLVHVRASLTIRPPDDVSLASLTKTLKGFNLYALWRGTSSLSKCGFLLIPSLRSGYLHHYLPPFPGWQQHWPPDINLCLETLLPALGGGSHLFL